MKILIIDYGMGNVMSVKRAFEECGATDVIISNAHSDFDSCTHIVLPGVGAYPDAMKNLEKLGLDQKIKFAAKEKKIPFLGICLGMQLLGTHSNEVCYSKGLGLIPGKVEILLPNTNERIPHVGWNEVVFRNNRSTIFDQIPDKSDFYFVHSYHFMPIHQHHIISETPYCGGFISGIQSSNIIGVQFHPEKSSSTGFRLLKNFITQ